MASMEFFKVIISDIPEKICCDGEFPKQSLRKFPDEFLEKYEKELLKVFWEKFQRNS